MGAQQGDRESTNLDAGIVVGKRDIETAARPSSLVLVIKAQRGRVVENKVRLCNTGEEED